MQVILKTDANLDVDVRQLRLGYADDDQDRSSPSQAIEREL